MQTGINLDSTFLISPTRETLKREIDKIDEMYLEVLYKVISAFRPSIKPQEKDSWQNFIDSTYGSFSSEPIIRANQGQYEERELFE